MKEEKTLEELITVHDTLKQKVPDAVLLSIIKRQDEYIVLYRDDSNTVTPYVIHHINSSGLYFGHYYDNLYVAGEDFAAMR